MLPLVVLFPISLLKAKSCDAFCSCGSVAAELLLNDSLVIYLSHSSPIYNLSIDTSWSFGSFSVREHLLTRGIISTR